MDKQKKQKRSRAERNSELEESSAAIEQTDIAEVEEEKVVEKRKKQKKSKPAKEEAETVETEAAEEEQPKSSKKKAGKQKNDEETEENEADDAGDGKAKKSDKKKKTNEEKFDDDSIAAPKSKPAAALIGTRVFCGNLSFKIDENTLTEAFASCGPVESIHWVTDKATGKFYGSAFVNFETTEAAKAALEMNGHDVLGRPVKINWATGTGGGQKNKKSGQKVLPPVSQKPADCVTVFVGQLPYDVEDEALREMFGKCGEIQDVRYVEKDGLFKCCAFIDFVETAATDKAVKLNGTVMGDRSIRVDYAAT